MIALDVSEVDLLGSSAAELGGKVTDELGGDSLSAVSGVDVEEVDEGNGARGVEGSVFHVGLGVGDYLGVFFGDEGDLIRVLEGGVDLGGDVLSALRGDPPSLGV